MLQAMNTTANPCEDFFEYACGNWLSVYPIPPDKASWGVLSQMGEDLSSKLKGYCHLATSTVT